MAILGRKESSICKYDLGKRFFILLRNKSDNNDNNNNNNRII